MPRPADRVAVLVTTLIIGGWGVAACGVPTEVTVVTTVRATTTTLVTPAATTAPAATTTSVSTTTEATAAAVPTTPPTVPPTVPLTVPLTVPSTVPSTTVGDSRVLALDLLAMVKVEREHRGGYERELFGYPTSFGGGCDTRDEVLRRDSLSPVQMDPVGCTVIAGDWYSPYDDLVFETPQDIEIDHVVALKEAWDSGAWQWSTRALEAFANDVSDPRTLRAVSGDSNRDKSDKDPSNWLPLNAGDVCRFVGDWTAIKVRWGLSMDDSEFGRVRNLFRGPCAGWRIDPISPTPVPVP